MSTNKTAKKSKRPLGRGLSNLLAGAGEKSFVVESNPNYKEIAIQNIEANNNQPRKKFDLKELEELATTLHSVGLIEPVVVRVLENEKYQLIAGERRWRAAQIAGFKRIPAVIRQANELQAIEIGIIENIQREELNAVEEGRAYEHWMSLTNQKPDVLAKKIGKSRSTVRNLTRILKLPPEVLTLIEENKLSVGQARPLLSIGDARQLIRIAQRIVKENWNSRKVEDEVARLLDTKNSAASDAKKADPNVNQLEHVLRTRLTAKVHVHHKRNGSGKIIIHYGNLSDMDRLLDIIGVR